MPLDLIASCGFWINCCLFCSLFYIQRGWILKEDKYYYFEPETDKEMQQEIPAYKMIQHMLEYAKELERIVWQKMYQKKRACLYITLSFCLWVM